MRHFADRLMLACRAKGAPVCVGLDPVYDRLPPELRGNQALSAVEAIERFSLGVLNAVAEHVPVVKVQAACYERYYAPGAAAMERVVREARGLGLVVILDAKRGDIGISSAHYAAACLEMADALTINSYLGIDAIEPFITTAAAEGRGLFALVRTSNPGSDAVQNLRLADGRTVAEAVAGMIADAGAGHVGQSGYSLLGAVVGATKPDDAARLRRAMPEQVFLVPGFGAQGGKADDVKACFNADGRGALITASRSVLFAYEKSSDDDWQAAISRAALDMKREIAAVIAAPRDGPRPG